METEVRISEQGHKPRNVGGLPEARKDKEIDSPLDPPKGRQPYQLLILGLLFSYISEINFGKKCERINLCCCCKPLHLWYFVITAAGNSYPLKDRICF